MEKAKIRPSPHQNPLTDLHKIGRRDYVLDGIRHAKFCSDRIRGFCSPNTWFAVLVGWLVFVRFFGFFNKAIYSLHPWTDIYAKYVKWRRSG